MILGSPGPVLNGRIPGRRPGALQGHPAGLEAGTDRLGSVTRSRSTANPAISERYRRFLARFFLIGAGYSSMPANVALRCQSNKEASSSWACNDGAIGADL